MNVKSLSANILRFTLGLGLVLVATASSAYAIDIAPVPEIGPGELGSAVTLLAGGYLMLSSRFRGK